jgi:hypothetical protein
VVVASYSKQGEKAVRAEERIWKRANLEVVAAQAAHHFTGKNFLFY